MKTSFHCVSAAGAQTCSGCQGPWWEVVKQHCLQWQQAYDGITLEVPQSLAKEIYLQKEPVAQWVGSHPTKQKVTGSIPGQGT